MKRELKSTTKAGKTGHSDSYELSEKQNLALVELFKGSTDEQAAKVAGVSRQTVNEWKNHCPAFIAAVQNHRAQIWEDTINPLREALLLSMKALRDSIEAGNLPLALELLEKAGADEIIKSELSKLRYSPTTPEAIAEDLTNEELERLARENADEQLQQHEFDSESYTGILKRAQMSDELYEKELNALKKEHHNNCPLN